MFRFKLNAGTHSEAGKTYKAGAEFNTKSDLRRFNTPRTTPRFVLLSETPETPAKEPEADKPLLDLHFKQLEKMAKEAGLDTTDLTTKEDLIAALKT